MADMFEKWNKQINVNEYLDEIAEIEANGGSVNFEEVPFGLYEVEVEKLELRASKKGDPIVSIWFNIIAGEKKGQKIFMNQLVLQPFQIYNTNEFLKQLDTDVDVKFTGKYSDYNNLMMDIKEVIDAEKLQYALEYSSNAKGYPQFKIMEVFEA